MCFNTKKIISVFLTVAMLFSLSGIPTFAEETEAVTEVIETVEQTETEIEETSATEQNEEITETEEIQLMSENVSLMSTGTAYYISTAEELNNVRNDLAGTYYLMNDIDLSSYGDWVPIGHSTTSFSGVFNGQGHKITGMTIGNEEYENTGLFGKVTGTITNLGVDGTIATENSNVGLLAGQLYNGKVTNCYSTGSVEGDKNIGGLIGYTYSYSTTVPTTVENCYSRANVTGLKTGISNYLGGLIGKNDFSTGGYSNRVGSVIKRCYATGYIKSKNDNATIGGVVGYTDTETTTTILFCYYDLDNVLSGDTNKGFAASTTEMKNENTFTGWDFDNVWAIDGSTNDGYPYLQYGETVKTYTGTGTIDNPYIVSTELDLINITEGIYGTEEIYYELANDIVLTAPYWTPIGGNKSGRKFNGYFDGAGHTISGINITQDNFAYNGLFGEVTGTITNLGVSGTIKINNSNVGLLAGQLYNGTITNCYSTGSVEGYVNVGGLIGMTYSYSTTVPTTVENCYSKAKVSGLEAGTSNYLGGLIGKNDFSSGGYSNRVGSVIKNSYSIGYIDSKTSNSNLGGFLGYNNNGEVTACYYDQTMSGMSDTGKGIPLSSEEMKTQGTFVIWDFDTIWAINSNVNSGYPYLQILIPADVVAVTGVKLNKSTLSMIEGNSETLTATITPTNATNNGITWTSSNTSVATVSNGKVTAKAAGTATITVTTSDGGYTASCVVTVTAVDTTVSVTGVTLNKSAVSLEEGKTETLVATVAPSNATDSSVSWNSSNTGVATVVNGKVTAISAGTAVITATTTDGGYTANCTVTVTEKVIDENAPKITITDIKTMPGKEIQVTVDLANNTGFASLGIEVGYNSDIMTLTNVTSNTGVGGTFTKAQYLTVNPFNMGWDSASNITYNGNLATLTFTVGEDVADGIYPITLDYYKGVNGNYVDGDNINYDENFEAVGFVYISGNVIVASYIPGDINGDESVDNKDATYLLRYLAGWSISGLVEDALDVDGSTSVDNKDATILLRYLAGWNVTLH